MTFVALIHQDYLSKLLQTSKGGGAFPATACQELSPECEPYY